jgi:hypothetical protein
MRFGFTGTEEGMSPEQKAKLRVLLKAAAPMGSEIHLGDCIGADEEARVIATELGFWTIGHPPVNKSKRAFGKFNETRPVREYLERNRAIVSACEVLLAAPQKVIHERCRHGTCATVRYAKSIGRYVHILERDEGNDQ